jgi:hypothetical protein
LSSVASALLRWVTVLASMAVASSWNFTIVDSSQAMSLAVSGWPSDHLELGTVWKVQVRPSADCCQLWAKYGLKSKLAS